MESLRFPGERFSAFEDCAGELSCSPRSPGVDGMIVEGVTERNSSSGTGLGDFAAATAPRRVDLAVLVLEVEVERASLLGEASVDRLVMRDNTRLSASAAALMMMDAPIGGDDGGTVVEDRGLVGSVTLAGFFVAAEALDVFADVSGDAETRARLLVRGIAMLKIRFPFPFLSYYV